MSPDFHYPIEYASLPDARLAHAALGAGEPVVLVHGSLCDLRYWKAQVPALSRDFQVFSISLPGYWPDGPGNDPAEFSGARHDAGDRHVGPPDGAVLRMGGNGPIHA